MVIWTKETKLCWMYLTVAYFLTWRRLMSGMFSAKCHLKGHTCCSYCYFQLQVYLSIHGCKHVWLFRGHQALIFSWRRSLSYRNQSIDLQSKLMDWFLYDSDLRHERVTALKDRPILKQILKWIFHGID